MPKSVLVADDSLTMRKAIGMVLSNEDFQVTLVDNGVDALQRAREMRPDVVLADVMMPGKSGYDVCGELKADPSTAHIPVLLLAGTFEPFDENRARAARADAHIAKPFESQAFIDKVRSLMGLGAGAAVAMGYQPVSTGAPAAPAAARPAGPMPGAMPPSAQPRPMPGPAGMPQQPRAPGPMPTGGVPGMPGMARPPGVPMGTSPGMRSPMGQPGMAPPMGGLPRPPGGPMGPGGMPPGPGMRPPMGGPGMGGPPPGMGGQGMGAPGMPRAPGAAMPGAGFPRPPGVGPMPGAVPPRRDPFGLGAPAAPQARGPGPMAPPAAQRTENLSLDDGGEANLRDALSKASREVIEKIAWEVVPQLAETIIREELDRLVKDRETKN